MGGIRLLIDVDGVVDVSVEGNGVVVYINMFGKVVVFDVNNYYRN